jgi:hypothetical protein
LSFASTSFVVVGDTISVSADGGPAKALRGGSWPRRTP